MQRIRKCGEKEKMQTYILNFLTMAGGLCLFLFGMNVMGQALEKRAGSGLRDLLGKMTTNRFAGLLTGLGITAVIQSSSATTVMAVGFVNSGIMTLKQAINVIMGANIGTTVTAWILSLGGISGDNIVLTMLKPMSFTPILALIGIIFYMFCKSDKRRDTGLILLGFTVLMFGMDIMSDSVSFLKSVPAFTKLFIAFENPVLGVIAGAVLTAVIQSSSASVGILQALASTGAVSYGAAIPIIMGQNIGTCITAILSSFGTNRNAKRTALVHLSFNVLGTVIWLSVFSVIKYTVSPALFGEAATLPGIAIAHSAFNIACTVILFPMSGLLEKLAYVLVPEKAKQPDKIAELDERLLQTPALAVARASELTLDMAKSAIGAMNKSLTALRKGSLDDEDAVREAEDLSDHYEDAIGTYLVKLSAQPLSEADSREAARLLKLIGDLERISDHAVNVMESVREIKEKNVSFSAKAEGEIAVFVSATEEILELSLSALEKNDTSAAYGVEPLEEVIDDLKDTLRENHISRVQKGECSIGAGFVYGDILTDLERVGDHCSNIAGGIIDLFHGDMNMHEALGKVRGGEHGFERMHSAYAEKYSV